MLAFLHLRIMFKHMTVIDDEPRLGIHAWTAAPFAQTDSPKQHRPRFTSHNVLLFELYIIAPNTGFRIQREFYFFIRGTKSKFYLFLFPARVLGPGSSGVRTGEEGREVTAEDDVLEVLN